MTNEPTSGPAISAPKPADVEYDDFGLPIRKPRPRPQAVESSDEEDEKYEDAVATSQPVKQEDAQPAKVTPKTPERTPKKFIVQGNVEPEINGRVSEKAAWLMAAASSKQPTRNASGEFIVQGNVEPVINGHVSEKAAKIEQAAMISEKLPERTPEKPKPQNKDKAEAPANGHTAGALERGDEAHTAIPTATATTTTETAMSKEEKEEGDNPIIVDNKAPDAAQPTSPASKRNSTVAEAITGQQPTSPGSKRNSAIAEATAGQQHIALSEYSHQQLVHETHKDNDIKEEDEGEWQDMPSYAHYDMYDDDNKLIAKENAEELEDMSGYGNVGGAAKGYSRVIMDDDVESQTSMDENTAYLFNNSGSNALYEDDEAARDPLSQMQTTKNLLTETQRIAYVGLVRLALAAMVNKASELERTKGAKKVVDILEETTRMWSQKMMVRLYTHMEVDTSEQIMIEQLSEHGVLPADLTPALMQNARVKNPAAEMEEESSSQSFSSSRPESPPTKVRSSSSLELYDDPDAVAPPPYKEHDGDDLPEVRTPSQLPRTKNIDIDLRWTILCDLFLVLIADSVYDARSRQLLEEVGKYLSVDWLELCRFEKRVTDALEMQEDASKENWNEDEHMENRRKRARNRRLALMGLATVGGGLVIGLSAGILAPVIGGGIAAGLTTLSLTTTAPAFLTSAGGAAIITTTGVLSGSTIGVRAADRRTGSVKTFEYRPLHNNKRVHLIVTLAGWMNGKVDDVRLPYSTVDPTMGDIYSVLWEPEMLRSMGDTINILATEVS